MDPMVRVDLFPQKSRTYVLQPARSSCVLLSYRGRAEQGSQSNLSAWANDSDFDDDDQCNDLGSTAGDIIDYVPQSKPRIGRPPKNPGKASARFASLLPCKISFGSASRSRRGQLLGMKRSLKQMSSHQLSSVHRCTVILFRCCPCNTSLELQNPVRIASGYQGWA